MNCRCTSWTPDPHEPEAARRTCQSDSDSNLPWHAEIEVRRPRRTPHQKWWATIKRTVVSPLHGNPTYTTFFGPGQKRAVQTRVDAFLAKLCEADRDAVLPGLSGTEDPYEAYRKARKPLPPQRSGPMGHKKGKKGYDRKRDKRRQRKEDA